MSKVPDLTKRVLVGRALRSGQLHEQLLPKRIALPVFASDPLSSVAYAPQELLMMLAVAGASFYAYGPWIALAIAALMAVVVASYRQNVHAYPSGGGDYEVAMTNLGPSAGLTVASALLVDYVLTVAVSVSSGVENIGSAIPLIGEHKVAAAIGIIALLTVMNLRGVRESGTLFAIPTYAFVIGVLGMVAFGLFRLGVTGDELRAPTADLEIRAEHTDLASFALLFLLLRAFSSGCAALTGVEAISNGVPAFRKPKSRNAATTLLMMGVIAVTMFCGVIALALASDVRVAERPAEELLRNGQPVGEGYVQEPILTQVAAAVFGEGSVPFLYIAAVTALILFLAANTAYNGFPVLGSILARDGFLPRQLHTRGDRLAFSNGIIILAAMAGLLVYAFQAEVTKLIQLYIVGVFVSFTLSQIGMVRHWNRHLRTERDPRERARMHRSRAINAVGGTVTGAVLVIVLLTKFTHGAWIVCIAMPVLFALMKGIRRHYDTVARELAPTGEDVVLPARNHAVVLVSKIHKPTLRALAYARATRPSTLEAVTVAVDPEEVARLREEWEALDLPVTLKILDSPYREVTRPVLDYVKKVRRRSPRDVVTVFIPEYVVGHWWEHLLHNQSALRMKARLLFVPGVMVTSVPWQLKSSDRLKQRPEAAGPGSVRRPYYRGSPEQDRTRAGGGIVSERD
ncbi:APC family permease [Thermomonospora cellulosilytica]|uniref:Amino acid transporter n=1 Tax=Thermomonospora cellulosilytica TaxID=1411118 RepID=A0A7W3MZ42_9ACTN|nr:APC family permease [Thermomonospora cellulosilytica]MBA9004553.1 amino acid transporter [Thermomonospora cellulosilytica]